MLQISDLTPLGWTDWFEERAIYGADETVARVAAVDRDLLWLMDTAGTFRAKLAGRYLYQHQVSEERPCVGDWVCVERPAEEGVGLVRALLERRTVLRRKSAGAAGEYQMIAANVDYVVVVQSCHYDFNINRLERYLVMVQDGGAEPLVLLTKTDLVAPEVLARQLAEIEMAGVSASVLTVSNVTREGVDDLECRLQPGKTYCFVGSSGVGKSTLINGLIGREALQTGGVSGTGEGRHTTVRRELIVLKSGALVIDSPGMREFGVIGAESGISGSFANIVGLGSSCRYRDCSHSGEPGCAVLEAVESGAVTQEHYENYLKLRNESAFHEMSNVEKRKKDRDFGKFIKSVKKDLKKR